MLQTVQVGPEGSWRIRVQGEERLVPALPERTEARCPPRSPSAPLPNGTDGSAAASTIALSVPRRQTQLVTVSKECEDTVSPRPLCTAICSWGRGGTLPRIPRPAGLLLSPSRAPARTSAPRACGARRARRAGAAGGGRDWRPGRCPPAVPTSQPLLHLPKLLADAPPAGGRRAGGGGLSAPPGSWPLSPLEEKGSFRGSGGRRQPREGARRRGAGRGGARGGGRGRGRRWTGPK